MDLNFLNFVAGTDAAQPVSDWSGCLWFNHACTQDFLACRMLCRAQPHAIARGVWGHAPPGKF